MSRKPTGRLFKTGDENALVLNRTFHAPVEDVWASVTESERTARWFGPWEGDAGPGRTIKVQMAFEDGQPWCDMRVDACEPPRRLAVSMTDEAGSWVMELLLSEAGGTTELRLLQRLTTLEGIGESGPGWEYYLDLLVAAREGGPRPDFDDYYPSMKQYFEGLAPEPGDPLS